MASRGMVRQWLAPLGLLTLFAVPVWARDPDDRNLSALMDEVVQLEVNGQHQQAVTKLEQALAAAEADPTIAWVVGVVAKLFSKLREDARAIEAYKRAIIVYPEKAAVYRADLATIYGRQGQLELAIAEAQQSVALDPHDQLNLYNLGAYYAQRGDMAKARETFQRTVEAAKLKGDAATGAEAQQALSVLTAFGNEQSKALTNSAGARRAQRPAPSTANVSRTGPAGAAPDAVVLKNGNVVEGRILAESDDELTIEIPGTGSMQLSRAEVASIRRRPPVAKDRPVVRASGDLQRLPNTVALAQAVAQQPQVSTNEPVVMFERDQAGVTTAYVLPLSVALQVAAKLETANEPAQALDIYQAVLQVDGGNVTARHRLDALRAVEPGLATE